MFLFVLLQPNTIITEKTGGDICSCIEQKSKFMYYCITILRCLLFLTTVKITTQSSDDSVKLVLNCTNDNLAFPHDIEFTLKIISTNGYNHSLPVNITHTPCPSMLTFNHLQPSTNYSISVVYTYLSQSTECNLHTFSTSTKSETSRLP